MGVISNMEFKEDFKKEKGLGVEWIRPDVRGEMGEIKRTAQHFSQTKGGYEKNLAALVEAIEKGIIGELTNDIWMRLANTDSFHSIREGHIEDVAQYAAAYKRDYGILLEVFEKGGSLPAPIIAMIRDKLPYLVSGNTRLMVARAIKKRPQALFAKIDFS